MTLIEKFDAVEIKADNRITETDRQFCQQHQSAYQAAVDSFQQLLAFWRDVTEQQRHILFDPERLDDDCTQYLISKKFPELTVMQIMTHIKALHSKFIATVVDYLNAAYYLTVDADAVKEDLLPQQSDDDPEDDGENILLSVVLRYEDIIELILSWFDGRTFSEQAPYELVEKCHRASWRKKDRSPNYEQKKAVVKILSGACNHGYWDRREQWHLYNSAKDILKGLAHFETGLFDDYPDELRYLIPDDAVIYYDLWELEECDKLEQIKLFKNGRMDIRFTNEGFARQFVSDYLGTVW